MKSTFLLVPISILLSSCSSQAQTVGQDKPASLPVLNPIEAKGDQLLNLDETPKTPRFKVTDKIWPEKAGDASICLWADDKIAPISFTIDDNTSPDVPWWLEMSDKYGFKATWFIISANVGNNGWGGTWELWKDVLAKGNDIQSHTHTHLVKADAPDWPGIEWEYAESKKVLEQNLPGHRVRFLAYSGGKNSEKHDRSIAAKYYAGARGATGTLVSPSQMDYFNTRAIVEESFDNPKAKWADMKRVLDPTDSVYRASSIYIYHTVKDKNMDRPMFKFMADNKDKFWIGLYGDISLYGLERDTATLKVEENTADRIAFSLTDRMADAVFDYPLTVKVRLPDGWNKVTATQNAKAIPADVIEHEGAKYALVKAVPDKGQVLLKK